jgi:hypothetical protein
MIPVRSELGFCITEDGILHSHLRDHLKSYRMRVSFQLEMNT